MEIRGLLPEQKRRRTGQSGPPIKAIIDRNPSAAIGPPKPQRSGRDSTSQQMSHYISAKQISSLRKGASNTARSHGSGQRPQTEYDCQHASRSPHQSPRRCPWKYDRIQRKYNVRNTNRDQQSDPIRISGRPRRSHRKMSPKKACSPGSGPARRPIQIQNSNGAQQQQIRAACPTTTPPAARVTSARQRSLHGAAWLATCASGRLVSHVSQHVTHPRSRYQVPRIAGIEFDLPPHPPHVRPRQMPVARVLRPPDLLHQAEPA